MQNQTNPQTTVDLETLKLLKKGIQNLIVNLEKKGLYSKIPQKLAKTMAEELEIFKKEHSSPEILNLYLFDEPGQREFLKQIHPENPKKVTLHLALTDEIFNDKYGLLGESQQLQFFFEFGDNKKYFLLLNTSNPTAILEDEYLKLTEAYYNSDLYRNLCQFIENETEGLLTENTRKIYIDDFDAGTNVMYNQMIKDQASKLKPFYIYPIIQTLDMEFGSTMQNLLKSASQLYSFGIIVSNEEDYTSSLAVIDDRHIHCPPACP